MPVEPQQRKSPEVRLAPVSKLVLQEPMPVDAEYVERSFKPRSRSRAAETASLATRATPLGEAMMASVPADDRWYLTAICYSSGEATALSSHIGRGGYGEADVRVGPVANRNSRSAREHYAVLVKRPKRRQTAA